MRIKTIEIAVGALMLVGLASLLMLAIQVSGLTFLFKPEEKYQIRAEFNNIGGLKVRAKVSVAGVVVGRVTHISLEPNSFFATVTLSIHPHRIDKLPQDTRASIMTAGLLGDNYISLTPGFDDQQFLQEGSVIPVANTDSALALEQLISKFLGGQATKAAQEFKGESQ